jgi:hypothetical protein
MLKRIDMFGNNIAPMTEQRKQNSMTAYIRAKPGETRVLPDNTSHARTAGTTMRDPQSKKLDEA